MKLSLTRGQSSEKKPPYAEAGVDTDLAARALARLLVPIRGTFHERPGIGKPLLEIGYFANVLDLGRGVGLVVAIDGVGTKALIAQMMDKYDTIGIDCVAMNANDVLCVGAEPLAMLDYVAVQIPDETLMEQIGEGLAKGAHIAGISIPGGEIAQIGEMLAGYGHGKAFDLVGCCVGLVEPENILVGRDIQAGDIVVGLTSSGIHSNGLTLARRVLLEEAKLTVDSVVPELQRTLGEELLEPTQIYVKPVRDMLKSGLLIKALVHITSDGFLNLCRVDADVGFVIEYLPESPAIFQLIAELGHVPNEEMFRVYNMGIGFCLVVDPKDAGKVVDVASQHGIEAFRLGYARPDPDRRVALQPLGLVGRGSAFTRV